jgi:hypothetical protein
LEQELHPGIAPTTTDVGTKARIVSSVTEVGARIVSPTMKVGAKLASPITGDNIIIYLVDNLIYFC